VPRVIIDPGNAPVSEESLEILRGELRSAFRDEYDVVIGGYEGRRELREATGLVPMIELFFEGLVGVSAVVTAVLAWRKHGKAPPRRVTRVQAWEFDEEGTLRIAWIEDIEENGG
jgi:hypothetical protein